MMLNFRGVSIIVTLFMLVNLALPYSSALSGDDNTQEKKNDKVSVMPRNLGSGGSDGGDGGTEGGEGGDGGDGGSDGGDPGNGDPGNGDPGNGDPGNGDPGNGDPGNEEPGNEDPGNGEPGGGNPGGVEPGNGDSGSVKPGSGNSEEEGVSTQQLEDIQSPDPDYSDVEIGKGVGSQIYEMEPVSDNVEQDNKEVLPKTGESSHLVYYLIGSILITHGIILFRRKQIV